MILGIGRLQQSIRDVRDDVKEIRKSVQDCLTTLIIRNGTTPATRPPTNPQP